MAELRLTGPTEDGDALRLTTPDGSAHTLPVTPYLRRLVVEHDDEHAEPAGTEAPETPGQDPAPETAQTPDDAPETVGQEDRVPQEGQDANGPSRQEPDEEDGGPSPVVPAAVDLTPRISLVPAAEPTDGEEADGEPALDVVRSPDAERPEPVSTVERPEPLSDAEPSATPVRPVAEQEDVRAAAAAEAVPLSPREIQARIRAGATVEQVARESGNAYSRIRTYGFPVLAERGYIAQQAQGVEVWVGGPDLYSSTVADGGPTTLGELAAHRLVELGADADALAWDAWREGAGAWTVVADFPLPAGVALPTREQPPARWSFRPAGRHLDPQNAWARILSDAEAWDVRHTAAPESATPDEAQPTADAEAVTEPVDAGQDAVTPRGAVSASADRDADLLEILRSRRGRRVGQDEESDDALAHLIAREAQAREAAEPSETGAGQANEVAEAVPDAEAPDDVQADAPAPSRAARLLRGLPALPEDVPAAGPEPTTPGEATPVQEAPVQEAPVQEPESAPVPAAPVPEAEPVDEEEAPATPAPRPGRERPAMPTPRPRARSAARRASVPSWDDIVFGRKGD